MPAPPLDLVAIRKQQRRIAALMSVQPTVEKLPKHRLHHHPSKVCSKLACNFCSQILGKAPHELLQMQAEHALRQEQRRYRRLLAESVGFDKTLYVDIGAMNLHGIDARGYGRRASNMAGFYFDESAPNGPPPTASLGNRNNTNDSLMKHWRLPMMKKFKSGQAGNLSLQIDSLGVLGESSGSRVGGDVDSKSAKYSSFSGSLRRHQSVRFNENFDEYYDDDRESELEFSMSRSNTTAMFRDGSKSSFLYREGSSGFGATTTPAFAAKYFKEQKLSRANLLNSLQTPGGVSGSKSGKNRQVKFDLERNKSAYFVSPDYSDVEEKSVESLESEYVDDDAATGAGKSRSRKRRDHQGTRQSSWCACDTPSVKSTERCSSCNTVGYHQELCDHFDEFDAPYCLSCDKRVKGDLRRRKSIEYRTKRGMKDVVVGGRRMTPPPKTPAKTPTRDQLQRETLWYNRFGVEREIPADFKLTGFLDSLDQYV